MWCRLQTKGSISVCRSSCIYIVHSYVSLLFFGLCILVSRSLSSRAQHISQIEHNTNNNEEKNKIASNFFFHPFYRLYLLIILFLLSDYYTHENAYTYYEFDKSLLTFISYFSFCMCFEWTQRYGIHYIYDVWIADCDRRWRHILHEK